jgi:hypothetical protein
MNVAKLGGKFETVSNFDVPLRGLYLLAAPNTPAEVIEAVAERTEQGERVTLDEVKLGVAAGAPATGSPSSRAAPLATPRDGSPPCPQVP